MKLKASALRIPSTDLDASLDFYSGKLRLDLTLDERAKGFLVFSTDSIDLIMVFSGFWACHLKFRISRRPVKT